jgi:hypothetical protein
VECTLVSPQVGAASGLDNCGRSLLHDPELGRAKDKTTCRAARKRNKSNVFAPGSCEIVELELGGVIRKDMFCRGPGRDEVPTKPGCEVAVPLGVATKDITYSVVDTILPVSKVVGSGVAYGLKTEHLKKEENTLCLSLEMSVAKDITNSVADTILPVSREVGSGVSYGLE